jgi:hypothetical protein
LHWNLSCLWIADGRLKEEIIRLIYRYLSSREISKLNNSNKKTSLLSPTNNSLIYLRPLLSRIISGDVGLRKWEIEDKNKNRIAHVFHVAYNNMQGGVLHRF